MRNGLLASILTAVLGSGAAWSQPEGPARPDVAGEASDGWKTTRQAGAESPASQKGAEGASAKDKTAPGTPSVLPPTGPAACDAVPGGPVPGPIAGVAVCTDRRPCGPPGRYWASAEYLLWWTKEDHRFPLVTTATPPDTGTLGQASTAVLFGNDIDYGPRHGLRLTAGMWLDECQTVGVEASTFCLLSDSVDYFASSPGLPVLARPFFDVATGAPGSELVAFPGLLAGGVNVSAFSKLKGCEANAICNWKCCPGCDNGCYYEGGRLDVLAGVRYLYLHEGLTVTEDITVPAGVPVIGAFPNLGGLPLVGGDRFGVEDRFRTENRFYGGQIGVRGEYDFGNGLFVNATGKLAYGVMQQSVDIRGTTAVVTPAGTTVVPGGLLVQTTNMGHYDRDRSAAISELNLNIGYQVDRNVRVFAGYTYLYVTNVVRPGDAVDFTINSTRVPTSLVPATGAARPAFVFRDSDFWAQGLSLGVEVRY